MAMESGCCSFVASPTHYSWMLRQGHYRIMACPCALPPLPLSQRIVSSLTVQISYPQPVPCHIFAERWKLPTAVGKGSSPPSSAGSQGLGPTQATGTGPSEAVGGMLVVAHVTLGLVEWLAQESPPGCEGDVGLTALV